MIINMHTASHPFYQKDRKAQPARTRRTGVATDDCVGMSLEQKCEWMRKRQELLNRQHEDNQRALAQLRGRRG
jgi:hypothetical protein